MNAVPHLSNQNLYWTQFNGLSLRCPSCGASLGTTRQDVPVFETAITCARCGFSMQHDKGIWLALAPQRATHYKKFMDEYQTVRAAEGRGSPEANFYLSLPFRDTTGNNQAQWNIRAKTFRYIERELLGVIDQKRKGLDILDLGAGNGWLSYRLSALGHRPVAVDLLINDTDGLGAASHYLQKLEKLFPRFQAELDHLPFESEQFDCVIFNASFHYSESYAKTLAEAIRCLRKGGFVIIADSPWYSKEESGRLMLRERRSSFERQFGFASDGLASQEFLTDRRLRQLEKLFGIRWEIHNPNYGLRWAMRPLIARLRNKREPSTFRIYVAEVPTS